MLSIKKVDVSTVAKMGLFRIYSKFFRKKMILIDIFLSETSKKSFFGLFLLFIFPFFVFYFLFVSFE